MTTDSVDSNRVPTRTKARKRALDILFEADLRDSDPIAALEDHTARAEPAVRPFTDELVRGVVRNGRAIDQYIAECLTQDWTLERMPRVDRNLARIAIFEMWKEALDPALAISEAVALSRALSTDSSPAFLNGVLGNFAKRLEAGTI
ncbi:MAG: transcription antitermination factor NusB [Propionibacteriaceae bacterium]|nr:transcription antitermination factor NusB [Micropruina sp.]HBX80852.1 transcription antitermination factor NusB [Propionibacteriaceae bacterium]HBY22719.1 transcription antitermination factor NusB [Propionibacteriaceae bacterium]